MLPHEATTAMWYAIYTIAATETPLRWPPFRLLPLADAKRGRASGTAGQNCRLADTIPFIGNSGGCRRRPPQHNHALGCDMTVK